MGNVKCGGDVDDRTGHEAKFLLLFEGLVAHFPQGQHFCTLVAVACVFTKNGAVVDEPVRG